MSKYTGEINKFFDIETEGLDFVKHRITCISIIDERNTVFSFSDESEKKLLEGFITYINKCYEDKDTGNSLYGLSLWAKNCHGFDQPFIEARMLKHGLDFGFRYVYRNMFKDINDLLPINPKTKRVPSLKDTCKLLGLESKFSDGLSKIYMWKWRDYETYISPITKNGRKGGYTQTVESRSLRQELIDYCVQDAKLVKQIWERLK